MNQQEFFNRYTYSVSRDRIGGGGFGTVYKAYDNVLHREVAIKVSEVKTTADGQKTFSLRDEFEALAQVPKHPNIANYEEFYSFEMPNGIFDYAVMQYYPDGNLSNAIRQGMTSGQKEDIATQLLEGIAFLHKHNVVHRDLKPGNILIVKHGGRIIPLITDFGLSKAANAGENSMFSNSFGGGTQRYSSPEQLQGLPLRLNTDLWSYGSIVYEIFMGEQLFSAGSGASNTAQADLEIYHKIVHGDVQSLSRMPDKWRKVVERCLVVDAEKRAKDATELFNIIKGMADDDETELATPLTSQPSSALIGTNIGQPSTYPSHSGLDMQSPMLNGTPKRKKSLWIGFVIAAVVAVLVLLLKPETELKPTDLDTQTFEACQTVEDYRAYIADFGETALHFADAQTFIENSVTDSIIEAQEAVAQVEAQKKEDKAYMKCTSVKACESYLKAYPNGRYVKEVKDRKEMLERQEEGAKIDIKKPELTKEETEESEIFEIVEEMPSFPGGEKKMYEFLSENIKYPQLARESGIQGKVFVEFVVEADGSISNVKLRRGIGGGCDEEVMRIVKLMPKWNPGKQRGKPVRVRYILPAMFKLNSGEEKTLLPLPTSNGRPDYVYNFSKWSSEVYNTTNTISQDAMLKETLNNYR